MADVAEAAFDAAKAAIDACLGNPGLTDKRALFKECRVKINDAVAYGHPSPDNLRPIVDSALASFRQQGVKAGEASMLLAKAELLVSQNEGTEALPTALTARTVAKTAINVDFVGPEVELYALYAMSSAYLLVGSEAEARKSAKWMAEFSSKPGIDRAATAAAHLAVSSAELESEPADALQAAERALEIHREDKAQKGEATALLAVARAHLAMEKGREGRDAAQEAVTAFRDLGRSHTRSLASALEVLAQAHAMNKKPMEGLRVANEELKRVLLEGDEKGAAALLEMIATTHATLGEPVGAIRNATEALQLYERLGDERSKGSTLIIIAEMQRAVDKKVEATVTAEKALRLFKNLGSRWGEEQAVKTLNSLLVERGQPEKAPGRKEAMQAVQDLAQAIKARGADETMAADQRVAELGDLISQQDIDEILSPVIDKDPGAYAFLEEQGFKMKHAKSDLPVPKLRQFPKRVFYAQTAMGGILFGPQFRGVHPYRVGDPSPKTRSGELPPPIALGVIQMPETETWQEELGFRPGVLDGALQVQGALGFPPNE